MLRGMPGKERPDELRKSGVTMVDDRRLRLKTCHACRLFPGGLFDISLMENANSRSKRAVRISTKLWPYKIPYVIDDTYQQLGPRNTMILKRAMKYIMDRVCIEFVDVTDTYKRNESKWLINNGFETNSYIQFSNGGCSAVTGPASSGPRVIKPCYDIWINLHELGHAIGAGHVHTSPNRDNYITVHNDNIKPKSRGAFKKNPKPFSVISSYFDPTSFLMYPSKTFTGNGLESFSFIIDDLFSTASATSVDEALFSDLNQLYKCREKFCNDPSVDCSPGYMARVKGVCRCVCPKERDEGNNCKTLRNGPLAYTKWPSTPMVLLAGGPQHTCPEGFTKGWFSFTGKHPMSQDPKPPVVFPSSGNTNYIPVCTKDTPTGSDIDWESWNSGGRYCMIKPNVPCGGAFVESQLEMNSLAAININGSVGDTSVHNNNLTQRYCCRTQDIYTFPTELPNAAAFRLFTRGYCPIIRGLKMTKSRNSWKSKIYTIINQEKSPFRSSLTTYTCYYQPPVYGCNREITLDAKTKTATVTTPGFPDAREPNRRCFYSFNVPPGSRIKITFNTVDLSTTNDDTFQYKRFHKWLSPNRIDPTNWPKDIVSEGDYFTAEFWSGYDVTTNKGVSFTATLITPEDMCYDVALKGADYSGNTNVAETYEDCLSWSKAVECDDFPQSSSIWLLQSGNSCRNPGGALLQPYCYVHINGTACQKRYCDVCNLKSVVDIIKNCSALMAADPGFCSNSFSKFGCAKSCAYTPTLHKRGTCDAPTVPPDGILVSPNKSAYNEGEIVQFNCTTSNAYLVSEKKCTKSGWTSLTKTCKGCSDIIDFCQDLLRTFPRFCSHTKTKDSGRQFCPNSCPACNSTTTCSAPRDKTFHSTSDNDTVNNGDVMTFSCNAGLYYWSGDFERACGLNGELLGSNLDCRSTPPVTDVNMNLIRKRKDFLPKKKVYLLDKDEFKIPIKGVITRWYYHCKTPKVMTFAVYRKSNSNVFIYVGANNVTCQPDYLMTYYVPAESQIQVEANDILAAQSTASNTLYVSNCNGYNLVPFNLSTIEANTFSELTTKTVSGTYCLIPSFGARVTPV
ncbi:hypothetical protein Btru_028537 [Bulinus truncatus]|nr:hypothetical protein Btru_028537 [Bulinus truncatus]